MNHKFAHKINRSFYYGWIIVIIAAISIFFSAPGQSYSIGFFMKEYQEEFDLSSTFISSVYTGATLLSGFLLVFMGRAVDRYGQRKMLFIAGFMLAVACFYNSFNVNIIMIFFGFFILRYFGQGSLTLIPNTLVPQWFEENRALAISIAAIGGIAGNMVVPIFNEWMIDLVGWRIAWRIWSGILVMVFLPLVVLFVINKPEDIGLFPDNRKASSDEDLENELKQIERESYTVREALQTKEFWFVAIISMLIPMITTGIALHFTTIMPTKGVTEKEAAVILGLIALPGLFVPLIAKRVIQTILPKYIVSFTLLIIGLDLLFFLQINSVLTAALFILVYGIATQLQMTTLNYIWPIYFGRKYLGSIRGVTTVFMVVGSAFGPIPFGLSIDLTGSFNAIFIIMAIVSFAAIILSLSINRPIKSE